MTAYRARRESSDRSVPPDLPALRAFPARPAPGSVLNATADLEVQVSTATIVRCPSGMYAAGGGGQVLGQAQGYVTGGWPYVDSNGTPVGWTIKFHALQSATIYYDIKVVCVS